MTFLALAASCAGPDVDMQPAPGNGVPTTPPAPPASDPAAPSNEGLGNIGGQALLMANCTITGTPPVMQATVADGEGAYLTLRASDNKVVLNATLLGGAPCEIGTGTVKLLASGTTAPLGRTVILDYANGLFGKGAGTVPGVVIDMSVTTNGSNDTLKVRGSSGVDSYALGATTTAGVYALNINAGSTSGLDSVVDVTFKQIEKVIVNAGAGDDIINASGVFGTGTAFPLGLKLYGAAGDDTITGGLGGDTIYGGAGNDIMDGGNGDDTFNMGTAADGNDTLNAASASPGSDTADYSGRTANLLLTIDGVADSGEGTETDKISDKIVNILAGSGNDTITVLSTSTVSHVVTGGAGDDTFTGGASADVFDGGSGDDVCNGNTSTMSYSNRTAAVTVTTCELTGAGVCDTNNNDGDPVATNVQKSGTAAAAADTGTSSDHFVVISSLAHMTQNDVGRKLRLTGFTTAGNDDGTTGYPITVVTNATTVTIDVTTNAGFDETMLAGTITWTLVGPEKDNVMCANVTGSPFSDTITGDARNNLLKGGLLDDHLNGLGGDDTLIGEGGADTLYGGAGSDTLIGGDGIDTLVGGDGEDVLQGDALADNFACDGKNLSTDGADGTSPGDSDFTVDFSAAGDMDVYVGANNGGCEN